MKIPFQKLKQINNILSVVVIALGLYIGLSPVLPYVITLIQNKQPEAGYVYQSEAAMRAGIGRVAIEGLRPIPAENRLVIPSIGVDAEIVEGETDAALARGAWRRPRTSDNPEQGNMVISAHRYLYTSGPKTFFYLDRLKEGDDIIVFWKGKEYAYKVSITLIVPPTQVSIEAPTADRLLTLYTCTPLWTAKNRLVAQAKPVSTTQAQSN